MNWHSLERREIPQAPPGLWQQLIQLPALPEGHLETQVSPGCCSQVISCSQVLSPFYSQVSPCFQVLSPDPRCSLLFVLRCSLLSVPRCSLLLPGVLLLPGLLPGRAEQQRLRELQAQSSLGSSTPLLGWDSSQHCHHSLPSLGNWDNTFALSHRTEKEQLLSVERSKKGTKMTQKAQTSSSAGGQLHPKGS